MYGTFLNSGMKCSQRKRKKANATKTRNVNSVSEHKMGKAEQLNLRKQQHEVYNESTDGQK